MSQQIMSEFRYQQEAVRKSVALPLAKWLRERVRVRVRAGVRAGARECITFFFLQNVVKILSLLFG